MADYKSYQQKENALLTEDLKYLCSKISDEEALKIHGLDFENDNYSMDSDSGKSSFDEEYFKYKPQPIPINRNKIVTIKQLNSTSGQHQRENNYLYNTKVKKGEASSLTFLLFPISLYSLFF